jgi:hypothetical protein
MSNGLLRAFCLALSLVVFAGCAPVQQPEGPPPPQNLLGATDQLQLVAELSLDLARRYGGDRVLVVLEIDNTLLAMEQEAECGAAVMRPTQADAAGQVRRMQDAGLKVIVLTSRGPECHPQTLRELSRNGFSFRDSAWPPQGGYPEALLLEAGSRPVVYQDGVFFAAGQDKGQMLETILEKSGEPYPVLIVMADHSQDNLNQVMKAFSFTSTKVHAWRYTPEDPAAAAPDH